MTEPIFLAASVFPPINATLNGISACFLLLGYYFIRNGKKTAHKRSMTAALICSALFLGCYVYYHYTAGHTNFPREYPIARIVYLCILVPHVLLAVVNVPLVIITVLAAIKGKYERHRKFAKITLPIWLFVSVTGVIVYFMIYQWFVPTS